MSTLSPNHTSYYQILNVSPTSTPSEIKSAYHRLLLSTHPDKTGKASINSFTIQEIQKAYRTLSDTTLKTKYDDELHEHYIKLGITNSMVGGDNGVLIDGIDKLDLSLFQIIENGHDDDLQYSHPCPRCMVQDGFVISESDLENDIQQQQQEVDDLDSNNYQLLIQCAHCSLWICITYSTS